MEWLEVEEWINENICKEFIDDEANKVYEMVLKFDDDTLVEMMDETHYKMVLKNIGLLMPSFMDRDMILDNLKDLLLVDGCHNYSLDAFMDWDGFVQAEIDEQYEEFNGMYIRFDELEDFMENLRKVCLL